VASKRIPAHPLTEGVAAVSVGIVDAVALLEIEDLHVDFPSQGGVMHAVDGVDLHVENAGWGRDFDLIDPLTVLSLFVLRAHGLALDMLLGGRDRGDQRYPRARNRRRVVARPLRIVRAGSATCRRKGSNTEDDPFAKHGSVSLGLKPAVYQPQA